MDEKIKKFILALFLLKSQLCCNNPEAIATLSILTARSQLRLHPYQIHAGLNQPLEIVVQ